ncbi:MAG: TetR/AcrR family transcriptional regulator [Ornithinimicrobium sp.]|uniref:TetR/AcrR family transcriptional regulator n=1 Tax=Ornithinimicrobium sp. TaxID=1977084 RepID=UPI003D9BF754
MFWFVGGVAEPGWSTGVWARPREQMTTEILDAAREQLAEQGAGGLSLRAVAREVGMVSSAIYRYFDSRDALLTALVTDAYNSLGEAVESAEGSVSREDLLGRWRATATTVRTWALDNPHLYALVYGSPVPGYAAPQETVGPASRVTRVLAVLLADIARTTPDDPSPSTASLPVRVKQAMIGLREFLGPEVPGALAMRGVMAWTSVFGAVSFELFGQLENSIDPDGRGDFFDAAIDALGSWLGVSPP